MQVLFKWPGDRGTVYFHTETTENNAHISHEEFIFHSTFAEVTSVGNAIYWFLKQYNCHAYETRECESLKFDEKDCAMPSQSEVQYFHVSR